MEARADDGAVRRALAAAALEFVHHQGGDLALAGAGLDRLPGRQVRLDRGVGRLADQFDLARVLHHAQGSDQRLHVARIHRQVPALQPFERELGILALVDQDHAAKRGNNVGDFVAQRVQRHDAVKSCGSLRVRIAGSELGPGPALGGTVALRQQQDLGVGARLQRRRTSGRQLRVHGLHRFGVERGHDQHRRAGLVHAGQVPEILVLAEAGERLGEVAFGGGKDDDGRAIGFLRQRLAACAVGLVGLPLQGEGGGGEERSNNELVGRSGVASCPRIIRVT